MFVYCYVIKYWYALFLHVKYWDSAFRQAMTASFCVLLGCLSSPYRSSFDAMDTSSKMSLSFIDHYKHVDCQLAKLWGESAFREINPLSSPSSVWRSFVSSIICVPFMALLYEAGRGGHFPGLHFATVLHRSNCNFSPDFLFCLYILVIL